MDTAKIKEIISIFECSSLSSMHLEAKPYVEVGSTVKEGDILCIIEAMKVMNEIHAPRAGVIKEIRAKDGDMVQFDEELMVIGD